MKDTVRIIMRVLMSSFLLAIGALVKGFEQKYVLEDIIETSNNRKLHKEYKTTEPFW